VASLVTFPWLPFLFLKIVGSIDNDFFIFKKRNKINFFNNFYYEFLSGKKSNNQFVRIIK